MTNDGQWNRTAACDVHESTPLVAAAAAFALEIGELGGEEEAVAGGAHLS